MVILNAAQIHHWDEYTILNEPISSIDLMERAASACVDWLMLNNYKNRSFSIFCGKGNNGGDGLAIARLLSTLGHKVSVYILEFGHLGTDDFQHNLERLHQTDVQLKFIPDESVLPLIDKNNIIIDALLGTGLNRPVTGLTAALVEHLNAHNGELISVDIPSGLSADTSSKGNVVIRAKITLSFQCYKLAFLVAENQDTVGDLYILDIGLDPGFLVTLERSELITETTDIAKFYRPRARFSHKGTFGHALLVAGSYGKMGAAVLSTQACLRTGTGLVTTKVPGCGYNILQSCVPEAMVITDPDEKTQVGIPDDLEKYQVIGIGPGIGTARSTGDMLVGLLSKFHRPMVVDADGLNLLAANPELLSKLPAGSILTPHPKEFERLFGKTDNDFLKIELARRKAIEHKLVVILKGRFTCIATPSGKTYFNPTGNAGLATGGSGDVLTGILTALVAQKYSSESAAILGVYMHGLAGELASAEYSEEAMIASDITAFLGKAFRLIAAYPPD